MSTTDLPSPHEIHSGASSHGGSAGDRGNGFGCLRRLGNSVSGAGVAPGGNERSHLKRDGQWCHQPGQHQGQHQGHHQGQHQGNQGNQGERDRSVRDQLARLSQRR